MKKIILLLLVSIPVFALGQGLADTSINLTRWRANHPELFHPDTVKKPIVKKGLGDTLTVPRNYNFLLIDNAVYYIDRKVRGKVKLTRKK